jgi:hypothetical protein
MDGDGGNAQRAHCWLPAGPGQPAKSNRIKRDLTFLLADLIA